MRLEALGKALTFFDIDDVFDNISCNTVTLLKSKVQDFFVAQAAGDGTSDDLDINPTDSTFRLAVSGAVAKRQ